MCVNAAEIAVSKDLYTGNEKSALCNTGEFEALSASKYLNSDTYLKRGDILLSSGHTAIVFSNGSGADNGSGGSSSGSVIPSEVEAAQSLDKALAGKYEVIASALNIRAGAGTGKAFLGTISRGEFVQCYGYYTQAGNVKWLYVQYNDIIGYCSSEYLQKG